MKHRLLPGQPFTKAFKSLKSREGGSPTVISEDLSLSL